MSQKLLRNKGKAGNVPREAMVTDTNTVHFWDYACMWNSSRNCINNTTKNTSLNYTTKQRQQIDVIWYVGLFKWTQIKCNNLVLLGRQDFLNVREDNYIENK